MKLIYRMLWGAPLALAVTAVYALGFGEVELDSALNQPFRANVPLHAVKPSEREAVTVRVASPDTFRRFGIARPNVLDDIQVEVVPGSDPSHMNVVMRSRRAIREPFLTFLLEAEWPQGRALREYTVLLDPPVTPSRVAARPAPQAAQPQPQPQPQPAPQPPPQPVAAPVAQAPAPAAPAPAPEPAPVRPAPPQPQSQPAAAPAPRPEPVATPRPTPAAEVTSTASAALQPVASNEATDGFAGKYGPVKAGETLSEIAKQVRPAADISMNQMLLSLFRANPSAFNGNVNRLRRGAILFVPDEEQFRSVNKSVATAEMRRQAQALRAPTPVAASSASEAAASSETAAEGAVSPQRGGELKLSPAPAIIEPSAQETTAVAAAEEPAETETAAGQQANDEASGENEATAKDSASESRSSDSGQATDSMAVDKAMKDDAAMAMAGDSDAADDEKGAELAADNMLEPGELEELGGTAASDSNSAMGGDSADGGAGDEAMTDAPADVSELAGEEPVAPESDVAGFPWALLLVLMALVSFCIAIVLFLRNRSQYKPVDFSTVTPAAATGGAAAALGSAYGDDEDRTEVTGGTESDGLEVSDAAASGLSVDEALREADGELAAGDWAAAASTLRAALREHPGEPLLQRRLMEALHAGNARDEFLDEVDSAYAGVPDSDPNWQAVAAMGRDLAPGDPRFGDAPETSDLHVDMGEDAAGDDTAVHTLDEDSASEFDLSDFDDGDDSDVTKVASADDSLDASDFEIEEGEFEAPSGEQAASTDETEKPDEDDFDLGNEALDFEFTDSFDDDKADKAAPDAEDATGTAAADGLSVTQMDDLSFTDDEEADAESDGEDDVSIKLDLARAYLDMGEPDMAVPLLEEVQGQGSDAQKQEAATLLERAK